MSKYSELKNILSKYNSFILTTHVNPDADAIGSQLAFHEVLIKLGKKVKVINHSITPYNIEFLDERNVIEKYNSAKHSEFFSSYEVLIALDLNQANRIVSMENELRNFNGYKICIDHHQDPEDFVDLFIGGPQFSATGEIIFDFIEETKIVDLNKRIADLLYAAIMTDTGSFRFDRTTPKLHKIAARLLELGVNPTLIYDKIYDQFKFGRIKLLGCALGSMRLDESGKIAYMEITLNDLNTHGATEADIDGFVNYCLSVQNVQIGILFYELKDGIKISFRSKGDIPVNKLAYEFNGGGHTNASGSRLFNITIADIKNKVIESARKYIV